LEQKIRGYRS